MDIVLIRSAGKCPNVFGLSTDELSLNVDTGEKENYRYYFRLNVIDKSGVLAGVTEIFRKYSLSIESLIQRGRNPNEEVPVIITTHETNFNTLQCLNKLCLFGIWELNIIYNYFESSACAAASLATGTLNGEQDT